MDIRSKKLRKLIVMGLAWVEIGVISDPQCRLLKF